MGVGATVRLLRADFWLIRSLSLFWMRFLDGGGDEWACFNKVGWWERVLVGFG